MDQVGERFVAALAAKDAVALSALFAPSVEFRGLTPGRFWEASDPESVLRDVLFRWFEPDDLIEAVEAVEAGHVADRLRVDYRLRVRNPRGLHLVEQRAYFDLDDDARIVRMSAICAGFQSYPGAPLG